VLSADHQNKADVASSKAREWMDKENLAMLVGGTSSGTALAMSKVAAEKKRPFLVIGAGSARLTNEDCTPYTVHYAYDTVALAKVAGNALVKAGNKNWYFLTADYAFGHSLEADASTVVKANGGTVAGAVRHPLNASDFSSFLLQAQSSKAQILALANAGGDFTNAMKAAKEFGIGKTMKVAGLLVFINDVHSLGLANTEGLQLADSWYWNQDDASRKFAKRFFEKYKRMPSSLQAADYSAATNYLKAVQAAGTTDGDKVMATLKGMKIDDFYHKGQIRADGRMIHDMYLFQVKSAKESTTPWDYYKTVAKVPGDQAFTTVAESKCALIKK
jgi:branched-chain amino acid transport system substrate-binding protein